VFEPAWLVIDGLKRGYNYILVFFVAFLKIRESKKNILKPVLQY
jgi:hypothetical protein